MSDQKLIEFFNKHSITFELHNHEAVFTTKESDKLHETISGAHSKNLFIKDKKKNYFLVSILDHKRVNLKQLSKTHSKGGFSFANDSELLNILGIMPGSVTPFGLINDKDRLVTFLLDKDFLNFESVNFHPLRNDMTINMQTKSFLEFFSIIEHKPQILEIPVCS